VVLGKLAVECGGISMTRRSPWRGGHDITRVVFAEIPGFYLALATVEVSPRCIRLRRVESQTPPIRLARSAKCGPKPR